MSVVLVTGAAGWVAEELIKSLVKESTSTKFIITDIRAPEVPPEAKDRTHSLAVDLTKADQLQTLFRTDYGVPDIIYACHGIMSRGSEQDFDFGISVNFDSVRALADQARHLKKDKPIRFVFTSSIGVFGQPLPPVVDQTTLPTPGGAYGTGKFMSELLLNEYTRRGFIDAVILRLPTVAPRAGAPTNATSSFMSDIIREPLNGKPATCPVPPDTKIYITTPRIVIENLVYASKIASDKFPKHSRMVILPGYSLTVGDEIEAVRQVGGEEAAKLISLEENPIDTRLVLSFPYEFDVSYAIGLGFKADDVGIVGAAREYKEKYVDGKK
ncbi:NAD(P)-binding protein [Atractiella rhizophila]|nr:NAD(P)-binding protein [Atractiella rhizophila]